MQRIISLLHDTILPIIVAPAAALYTILISKSATNEPFSIPNFFLNIMRKSSGIKSKATPAISTTHHEAFDLLNIAELMALEAMGRDRASAVSDHIEHCVEQMLRLFDVEPNELFKLLHATGSVISGSAALLALLPWSFEPGDLDIYVPKSQINFTLKVIRDMFGFELYHATGPYAKQEAIQEIFWFKRGDITINVIMSSTDNALEPIFHFHSTVVMNFISSVGIFCAYPRLTLHRRGLVNAEIRQRAGSAEITNVCIEKYRHRGFSMCFTLDEWRDMDGHLCTLDPSCPHTIRTVYDHGSLFYAFKRTPWARESTNLRVYGTTSSSVWCLGGNGCRNTNPTMCMSSSAPLLDINQTM